MNDITHLESGESLSQAVVFGDFIFLAGIIADRDGDVASQTGQILAKIDQLLSDAGSDKTRLLKANIWLADIGTWAQMNAVWLKWLGGAKPPARATVEAKLAAPDRHVEIMMTAARN